MSKPREQDDFDNSVNYQWKLDNPVPDKYPRYENFTILSERMESIMVEICKGDTDTLVNKIFNLFIGQTDKDFIEHTTNELNNVSLIDNKYDLFEFIFSQIPKGKYYLLHINFSGTCRNPRFQIPHFTFTGLSLPDKAYYTDRIDLRVDFEIMIDKIFTILSIDKSYIKNIWDIEGYIASAHYTKAEKRDPLKTYHPMTLDNFLNMSPGYFNCLKNKLPVDIYDIILTNADLPAKIINIFDTTCKDSLKTWIQWLIIKNNMSMSVGEIYKIYFDFYKTKLNGTKTERPIEERAILYTKNHLGDDFSKIYINNYMDSRIKTEFPKFVDKIKSSVREKLQNSDWMGIDATKLATNKLDNINLKLIGPEKYEDFSVFNQNYNSIYNFMDKYDKWDWDELEVNRKMYKPIDPLKWEMDSVDINAYYHPYYNEIVFPAAILQKPFYDPSESFGNNAGGIGAVIAHEISHGFDDKGSQYDLNGYLYNWLPKQERDKYEKIIYPMEDYFNNLLYNDTKLNGRLTQGENLADLGGLKCALYACETDIEKKKCIYSWAIIWRANLREEYAQQMIIVDPHSLPHYRINGILAHIPDFYRLFNVTDGDDMYLEEDKRCSLYN